MATTLGVQPSHPNAFPTEGGAVGLNPQQIQQLTAGEVAQKDAVNSGPVQLMQRFQQLVNTGGILVTGSHRSGTTWVGKMLATAPKVAYIHEPLKPGWNLPYTFTRAKNWFQHIDTYNSAEWEKPVLKTVRFDYAWNQAYREKPTLKQAIDGLNRWARWKSRRFRGFKPLLKDPIAIFATPWLADRFGISPVVMIRHPAAFVSSIKVKKWVFDFTQWTRQTELIETWLAPFRDELLAKAQRNDDIVDQAILQWRIFHHVIDLYRQARSEWLYVRHEDLSLDPVGGFKAMFDYCKLAWTPESEKTIRESSDEGNLKDAAVAGKSTHYVQLDSAKNIKNWQKRLSAEEIIRIRRGSEDVSAKFYSDQDWAE